MGSDQGKGRMHLPASNVFISRILEKNGVIAFPPKLPALSSHGAVGAPATTQSGSQKSPYNFIESS